MSGDAQGLGGRRKIQPEICNDSVTISAAFLISIKPEAESVSKPMNRLPERTSISVVMIVFNTGNIIARSPAQPSVGDLIAVDDDFWMAPRRS